MQYKSAAIFWTLAITALMVMVSWGQDSRDISLNSSISNNTSLNRTAASLTADAAALSAAGPAAPASEDESRALGQNAEGQRKVLRAGFEKTKAVRDLDVYGNKSVHALEGGNNSSPAAFNLSQRVGNISHMTYSHDYKPVYSVDEYSRTKAVYQAPSNLSSRAAYSISGYPAIKIANSIP